METEELEYVSEAVALSALKYYILKFQPQKDINFIPEESLSFDGATGPFAQYSYARLSSILRKGKELLPEIVSDFSVLGNREEMNLALLLAHYPVVVRDAAESLSPARIAAWIFDTARAINQFHRKHMVLDPDNKVLTAARGGLVRIARQVLGNSLRLLGIIPLERM
jgi:arginyl-tRNA synthetase